MSLSAPVTRREARARAMLHPCLSCPLPDCDEEDRRCALRRAMNLRDAKLRRGEALNHEERVRYNLAWAERHGATRNEKRRKAREERARSRA